MLMSPTMEKTMGSNASVALLDWQCTKVVKAGKVEFFAPNVEGEGISVKCHGCPAVVVKGDWVSKHRPSPGGYLVIYEDGYQSYSPAEAFEAGYFPLPAVVGDDRMGRWFVYSHLPDRLQKVSLLYAVLAVQLVEMVPPGPERTVALRKLLESKDAAVRAAIEGAGDA